MYDKCITFDTIKQTQTVMKRYHEQAYGKTLGTLTESNASRVATIQHKNHPEWGIKKFNYKDQPLNAGDFAHTFGTGSNSAVLFVRDMQHWDVVSFK